MPLQPTATLPPRHYMVTFCVDLRIKCTPRLLSHTYISYKMTQSKPSLGLAPNSISSHTHRAINWSIWRHSFTLLATWRGAFSVLKRLLRTLIKKKTKFSSYILKFIWEQLQSHIWLTASSYIGKYLRISSYIRKPFLIYDFETAPLGISLYRRKIWFLFYHCRQDRKGYSPPPPPLPPMGSRKIRSYSDELTQWDRWWTLRRGWGRGRCRGRRRPPPARAAAWSTGTAWARSSPAPYRTPLPAADRN